MPPISLPSRLALAIAALFAGAHDANALGLGELRTRAYLGEHLVAEVDVLTGGGETVDAGCFRLRPPQGGGDLPWLKSGSLRLRRGPPTVLEIRSEQPVREPVLQVGLLVACGHDMQRDYTLLFSPGGDDTLPRPETAITGVPAASGWRDAARAVPPVAEPVPGPEFPRAPARRAERRGKTVPPSDRLVLSGGGSPADPSLRLSTVLPGWKEEGGEAREAQREILRLEYRALSALGEQATSQLAAAEKLRRMEETLAALRSRTDDLAGRIQRDAAENKPLPAPVPPAPPPAVVPSPSPQRPSLLSEWGFYGVLLGALLGVGSWLGWQQYRQRREGRMEVPYADLEPVAEPPGQEIGPSAEIRTEAEPAIAPEGLDEPGRVDMPREFLERPNADITVMEEAGEGDGAAAGPSGAEGEESDLFEANPVMELAEIMLSFGRVKGAAQALQEFIDNNPEKALQPWIRLMDVYRMAGMREEFERVARDLNRHFNVEVQRWDPAVTGMTPPPDRFDLILVPEGAAPPPPESPGKAMRIEDIEHIRRKLIQIWGVPECRAYLEHLLRDNRGGQRSGFTLPVVEEILFLMELLETRILMDKQPMDGEKNE